MAWFRTKQRLAPWLIGLFLVAQISGVVPRLIYAQPSVIATTTQAPHQHAHMHADQATPHEHHDEQAPSLADQCCALHLLTGVVPFVVTSISIEPLAVPLLEVSKPNAAGVDPHRLDRPPRSLLSL